MKAFSCVRKDTGGTLELHNKAKQINILNLSTLTNFKLSLNFLCYILSVEVHLICRNHLKFNPNQIPSHIMRNDSTVRVLLARTIWLYVKCMLCCPQTADFN